MTAYARGYCVCNRVFESFKKRETTSVKYYYIGIKSGVKKEEEKISRWQVFEKNEGNDNLE